MTNTPLLKSNLELVQKVIRFFAAEYVDKIEFEKIKIKAIETSKRFNSPNGELFIKMGFLSPMECVLYISSETESTEGRVIDETIKALEEQLIIYPIDRMLTHNLSDRRYRMDGQRAVNLYINNLVLNKILGFEYIIDTYKHSVLKIEHICKEGKHSIGTGFMVKLEMKLLLITNKHVIENYRELNIYDFDDNKIEHLEPYLSKTKDIGIIEITNDSTSTPFILNVNPKILSEIITIGYPSIPMTRYAYQVYHKGEINSFVEDYFGNNLFLISAKTSAGNSGSPIIDAEGKVVGIVTQELFEKNDFYEKGKLPYYASIPAIDIINEIDDFKKCS